MKSDNYMRIASGLSSFFLSEEERRVGEGDGEEDVAVMRGMETVEDLDLAKRGTAKRSELLDLAAEPSSHVDIVRSREIGMLG